MKRDRSRQYTNTTALQQAEGLVMNLTSANVQGRFSRDKL